MQSIIMRVFEEASLSSDYGPSFGIGEVTERGDNKPPHGRTVSREFGLDAGGLDDRLPIVVSPRLLADLGPQIREPGEAVFDHGFSPQSSRILCR